MKPLLIMVGADKGGVGKTTVSRTLIDYMQAGGYAYRAFDTEHPNGVLKRFHPKYTDIVDLTEVSEQMRVFDTLAHNAVTLVDVRAGLLSPTLQTLANIGLLEMVKGNQLTLMLVHVLGPSIASLQEIETTSGIITGATHFLVKNHINDTKFFDWDDTLYQRMFGASRSGIIDIPQLPEMAAEHIETNGVGFTQFIANEKQDGSQANYSFVLKGLTRTWLKEVFSQYDRANINGIVSAAITS